MASDHEAEKRSVLHAAYADPLFSELPDDGRIIISFYRHGSSVYGSANLPKAT